MLSVMLSLLDQRTHLLVLRVEFTTALDIRLAFRG